MPKGKDLDFSRHINIMENLIQKLRAIEKICGGGLIHDVRLQLNILVNWKGNLEFYSDYDGIFKMFDWNKQRDTGEVPQFEPDQKYVDEYFKRICDNAEIWLVGCVYQNPFHKKEIK